LAKRLRGPLPGKDKFGTPGKVGVGKRKKIAVKKGYVLSGKTMLLEGDSNVRKPGTQRGGGRRSCDERKGRSGGQELGDRINQPGASVTVRASDKRDQLNVKTPGAEI